jgi:hypothetical protein
MELNERLRRLFPPIRWGSGIPPCLVSDAKAFAFLEQVGVLLPLFPPLGLAEGVNALQSDPTIDQIPAELCAKQAREWSEDNQVRDIFLAMDRVLRSLGELIHKKELQVQIATVAKTLPVLAVLFWSPQGGSILPQVARIFGCGVEAPAKIIDYYRTAIASGDEDTLLKLQQLVDNDPIFGWWTKEFADMAIKVDLPESPISLPLSTLVSSILIRIMEREEQGDNDRPDNREA